jgi:hypothetical protein
MSQVYIMVWKKINLVNDRLVDNCQIHLPNKTNKNETQAYNHLVRNFFLKLIFIFTKFPMKRELFKI